MAFEANKISFNYGFYLKCGVLQVLLAAVAFYFFYIEGRAAEIPALCFVGFVAFLGIYHIAAWGHQHARVKGLNNIKESMISMENLRQALDGAARHSLFIGWGFFWDITHTRRYHHIKNEAENELIVKKEKKVGGKHFAHNLNGSEDAMVLPLPRHTIIAGTTGIGKTRFIELLSLQIAERGECLIIIDPKGDKELLNAVYQACIVAGREDDFEFMSLAHPTKSCTMNPLAAFTEAGDIADRIASILPNKGNSQPFVDFCYDVLTVVVTVMLLIDKDITLANIKKYVLESGMGDGNSELYTDAITYMEMNRGMSQNQREQIEKGIEDLRMMIDHDPGHFTKMTTSLKPVMNVLTSGNVGPQLSPKTADLTWQNIIEDKKVVYINLASMINDYRASTVGKLIMQDLISYVGQIYSYKDNPGQSPVHCFVDEFGTVIYEGFTDLLNKSRGAGVHMYLGMQTTADIEAGGTAAMRRQVFGLVENKIYLRIPDTELAQELCATFGDVQIEKISLTRTIAAKPSSPDELFSSTTAERKDLQDVPLLSPEILTSLPRGHAIISTEGRPPIKFRFPLVDHDTENNVNFFEEVLLEKTPESERKYELTSAVDDWDNMDFEDQKYLDQ